MVGQAGRMNRQQGMIMSGNLPYLLSSFIGRQAELEAVKHLLIGHRLVTLTGPGGVGKTRLALAAAADVSERQPDGIFLVELASLTDEGSVVQTIAISIGLRETPGQEWLDGLIEGLRSKRALLLLDNCEHLLPICAQLTHSLLRACPQLTILATSRESLGLMGEVVWPVPPLSLPKLDKPPADFMGYDAIRLFMERATAVTPQFTLTEQNRLNLLRLCHRLDGLPLAIELAAARVRSLSIEQISSRLENSIRLLRTKNPALSERQQALTATIDWSYEALTMVEATLWRRLAVFVGGFTLTAVETICTTHPLTPSDIIDLLSQLVDKSLVVVASREEESTYRLLQTVRQYAWDKLAATDEHLVIQKQHARYYLELAQGAESHFRSANRAVWQTRLEAVYDNLLAALNWFARQQMLIHGAEMVWSLRWFWYFRGTLGEIKRQATLFLSLPEAAHQELACARLYWCIAASVWVLGDYETAYEMLTKGQALAEAAADAETLAYILILQGLMAQFTGQDGDHTTLFHQAVPLFQEAGDQWGEALGLYWLADVQRLRRDYIQAQNCFEQSRHFFKQLGDSWGVALALQGLGAVAFRLGDLALARTQLEACLVRRRASHDNWLTAQTLNTLATVLQTQGEYDSAVSHFREAETLYREIGDEYGRLYALFKLGQTTQLQGDLSVARRYFQDCLTLAESVEHEGRIADCQAALAELVAAETAVTMPPILHITAFGPGTVQQGDDPPLPSSDWGYARVRELFFYLLDSGPKTKGEIGLALWPDASSARLRRNLHDALYQLRRTLGDPRWIVYANGRYTFNVDYSYHYDVAEFTRFLQSPTVENLSQAADLYQADFLTEFDSEWCLLRREALRQQFLQALLQWGELLQGHGRYAQAADIYRQAIAYDDLLEIAYRELMRVLIKMGETAQAARQYQILQQILEDELGIAPAAATTALWRQIQQS